MFIRYILTGYVEGQKTEGKIFNFYSYVNKIKSFTLLIKL